LSSAAFLISVSVSGFPQSLEAKVDTVGAVCYQYEFICKHQIQIRHKLVVSKIALL
jgi:hypothetical protein